MYPNSIESGAIAILISGERPASGATSLTKRLISSLKELQLVQIPSGGTIRRSMALHWYDYSQRHRVDVNGRKLSERGQWFHFQAMYEEAFEEGPLFVSAQLESYLAHAGSCSEDTLRKFTDMQAQYGSQKTFWDKTPETIAYRELLRGDHNVIFEAKNATIIDTLMGSFPSQVILRFLLEVSARTSAFRTVGREIENNLATEKYHFDGLDQSALSEWWNADSNTQVPEGLNPRDLPLLVAWKNMQIEQQNRDNIARIDQDIIRYARVFQKPADIFEFQNKKKRIVAAQAVQDATGKLTEIPGQYVIDTECTDTRQPKSKDEVFQEVNGYIMAAVDPSLSQAKLR